MATVVFAYDHARDPMNGGQLADQIGAQLGLASNPEALVGPTAITVTHPQVTEAQRAAIQAVINAYVFDPVWAGGLAGALAAKAQAALNGNATFQAIASPTTAQTLAQVQLLTKECNALIRLATNLLDSTRGA